VKILVIQQKMIGDVLTSGILFSILRKKYPEAKLHYLINAHTYPVVEHHPEIDRFLLVTPDIEDSYILFYKFLKAVRHEEYNVVIDVYSKLSSNIITLLSKATCKISKHKWYTAFIYTHTFKKQKSKHSDIALAIESRIRLLRPLFNETTPKAVKPKIYLQTNEIEHAKHFLKTHGINFSKPVFMISVLGSCEEKTYPLDYMATVIDFIVAFTNATILLNYIPKQIKDVETVYNKCATPTKKHIKINVFGKSLREFMAITTHCTALIGNEGGAINMAKALEVPTFSIFSPWIKKEAWNMFEDEDALSDSIHLMEVAPELYKDKSPKHTKKKYSEYYAAFKPNFIVPKLKKFLRSIV
jgi:heptosyltransferase-2